MLNESDKVISDEMYVEQLMDEVQPQKAEAAGRPAWKGGKGFPTLKEAIAASLLKEEPPERVEETARRLVTTDRNQTYDHPFIDFTRVGRIWGAILGLDDISPEKVCLLLEGLKLSRQSHIPKKDNLIDGIGYWLCYDLVERWRTDHK